MLGVPTVLLCLVETFALAAPRVAVFPLTGEAISIADLPTVDAIDSEIRLAVQKRVGSALQSKEETLTQVQVLKDVGLVCANDDIDCQTRIAVMADVDEAITGVVSLRPGAHTLALTIIDRATTRAVAAVKGPISESASARSRDIDRLVERLLVERPFPFVTPVDEGTSNDKVTDGAPDEAPPVVTGAAIPDARTADSDAGQNNASLDERSAASWVLLVGGGVLMAGAGVATVGALGTVVGLELLLSTALPWETRTLLASVGQGLLVVAALSAVTFVAGGTTAGVSLLIE
jgi:hypothetical protein